MEKGQDDRETEEKKCDEDMLGIDESVKIDKSNKNEDEPVEEGVYGFGDSDSGSDSGSDDDDDDDSDSGSGSGSDSDDDSADEEDDVDMNSDLEEGEHGPDDRAWGKSNKRYYSTDYVDQDREGFYEGKEAEEAEFEEEEARQIQKRLIEELKDTDFVVPTWNSSEKPSENDASEEIERDVSSLSKKQKLDLMQKESPEFFVLVQDLKDKLKEIDDNIVPILNYCEDKSQSPPILKYFKKKFLLLTNYCTNISFYLLLMAKRIPVKNHPVLKSLYKYRKILEHIQDIDDFMKPQVEIVLNDIKDGKEPVFDNIQRPKKKDRNILKLLKKSKSEEIKQEPENKEKEAEDDKKLNLDEPKEENSEKMDDQKGEEEKRAITYEMAKNKGLMPKRNKDQRNPRVKHRKKYRKALIRRRGQVRTARSEIPVYGGEPTGIKANVTKSIKLK